MQTAKLFQNGRSQAVRLPAAFRFSGDEVYIRRDEATGDVILSQRPHDWQGFIAAAAALGEDDVLLRDTATQERDPFADWQE
ncbi:antitoxin VapB [Neisseria sp. HSC-16F19]|nr:AbrB/MazE/SpoVT family DNA-binding domain-containing protein [Neisseria sp. HSC-16F19]MCP2041057.1 antitoxin VapB [Neisseria sp. HSC-16F19]